MSNGAQETQQLHGLPERWRDAQARYCVHDAGCDATEGDRVVAGQRTDVQVEDSWQIHQPEHY